MAKLLRVPDRLRWFADARLGMFCHYGPYSLLGRGEWARNREGIDRAAYVALADRFTARRFDADALTGLAVQAGAKYITFTTKHHDGFCLYDSHLTDFTAIQRGPKRDLVREVVESARRRGLKISLYFSLNDWHHQPDAADAMENPEAYGKYIAFVHGQIRELLTRYGKIDIMWYDGWWPFTADGWQAKKMNAMARRLQRHILVNNRNGLPGDFGTPEQHLTPIPGRVWEACVTLNDHWGYFTHDHHWKSPRTVIDMIIRCARNGGNLLINVGPRGDGSIPPATTKILHTVGQWVRENEPSLRPGMIPPAMDWNNFCLDHWTARPGITYMHVNSWPGKTMTLCGVKGRIRRIHLLANGKAVRFRQDADRLHLLNLPPRPPNKLPVVLVFRHDGKLSSYQTAGMRVPKASHVQYDPVAPNLPAQHH